MKATSSPQRSNLSDQGYAQLEIQQSISIKALQNFVGLFKKLIILCIGIKDPLSVCHCSWVPCRDELKFLYILF